MTLHRRIYKLVWLIVFLHFASGQNMKLFGALELSQLQLESDLTSRFSELETQQEVTISAEVLEFRRSESKQVSEKMCDSLQRTDSFALLDMTWGGWIRGREVTKQIGMPYTRVQTANHPYINAVSDFLGVNGATEAIFIFPKKDDLDQCMYYIIMYSDLRVTGAWMESVDSINTIRDMKPRPSTIVTFGTKAEILNILKEVGSRDIMQKDSHFVLVFTDFVSERELTSDLLSYINDVQSTTVFLMEESTCCKILNKNAGCTCNNGIVPPFLSSVGEVVVKTYKRLTSTNGLTVNKPWTCNDSTPDQSVKNAFIKALKDNTEAAGLTFYTDSYNGSVITQPLSFKIKRSMEGQLVEIGKWNKKMGFKPNNEFKKENATRFFKVGFVLGKPWAWIKDAEEAKQTDPKYINKADKNKGLTGYTLDLLEELSKTMNFDYEVIVASDNAYGSRNEAGEWNGIMGDLIKGRIDISLASLIMTTEREEYVDFVTPYYDQSGISILLREKVQEQNIFKFILVLEERVWFGICGCVLVVIVLLWILDKLSPYSYTNNKDGYPEGTRDFTFGECIWFGLTSLTPQGGGECPKSLSSRVLVAAYWLFIVLMLATFTANLAALLTVERMETTVQSLEELARQSQVNYTVLAGSPTEEYFKNMAGAEDELYNKWKEMTLNSSKDETKYRVWDYPIREQYNHIYNVIKKNEPVSSPEQGFQRVMENEKGDFAFIHDASEVKYAYYKTCPFLEIGEPFAEQPLAVAVQEGSSLSKEISQEILRMQKDRFFERVHSKFWNIGDRNSCPITNDNQGITLHSLGGIFLIAGVGLILSIIMLAYEVWQEKKEESINDNMVKPMFNPQKQFVDKSMYGDFIKNNQNISTISRRDRTQTREDSGSSVPAGNVIRVSSSNQNRFNAGYSNSYDD